MLNVPTETNSSGKITIEVTKVQGGRVYYKQVGGTRRGSFRTGVLKRKWKKGQKFTAQFTQTEESPYTLKPVK